MAKTLLSIVIIFVMIQFISKNSYSVEPEELLQDPRQETRARNISKNIRCLVCQNQNLADSNADLAKDLRDKTYQMIMSGQSDQEIFDYSYAHKL